MTVECTTDYAGLKFHPSNRLIDEGNLLKLKTAIKKKNLLEINPILVNDAGYIIDGQHRFQAAKDLKLPLYYQKSNKLEIADIALLNNNRKNWNNNDYFEFYASQRCADYIHLKGFMDAHKLKLSVAMQILNGYRQSDCYVDFRAGHYKFPDADRVLDAVEKFQKIKQTIDYISRTTSGTKLYLTRVTFYGALAEFFSIRSFIFEIFMQKLQYKIDYLHPCTRQRDYLNIFKEIYNFKNQNPIELENEER